MGFLDTTRSLLRAIVQSAVGSAVGWNTSFNVTRTYALEGGRLAGGRSRVGGLVCVHTVLSWVETPVTEVLEDAIERGCEKRTETGTNPVLERHCQQRQSAGREKHLVATHNPMAIKGEAGDNGRPESASGVHCRTSVVHSKEVTSEQSEPDANLDKVVKSGQY
jgi:hypothetical protein